MSQPVANGPERRWTGLAAYLAGVAALAVVLTLSGAYDTDGLGVAHRLALWLVVGGLLVGQVVLIERALTQLLPRRAAFRLVSGVLSLAATLVLITFEMDWLKTTPLLPKARDPFWEFLIFLAPLVGALGGFVLFLRALAGIGPETLADKAEAAIELIATRPVIAGLLPAPKGGTDEFERWPAGRVLFVHANDHYLDVQAETGRAFVRGRMRDAVARLRGEGGLQIHRSWWVAQDQIARIERDGRDHVALLQDGQRIPVGRSRLRELRSRGLV